MGGAIVLALTYILYGFIAPRFAAAATADAGLRTPSRAAQAAAVLVALVCAAALMPRQAHAQPIVEPSGKLLVGYYGDARPFSFENESGKATGYAVELCQKVADLLKAEVSWQRVRPDNRLTLLKEGKVKVLCGEPVTLSARQDVSFSIPIFQGGVGALVRADAQPALVKALSERPAPSGPVWRGMPTESLLQAQTFAVVAATPTEKLLGERLKTLQLTASVSPVKDYAQGIQAVLDRKANAFFADRSVLLDAVKRNPAFADLKVVDRRMSVAPVAIALARGNEDARLAVDRSLSRIYATQAFRQSYVKWFGEPDADTVSFFRLSALPE